MHFTKLHKCKVLASQFLKYVIINNNYIIPTTQGFLDSSVGKQSPAMQETPVQFLGQEDPLRRDRLPTPVFLGFPGSTVGKESACNLEDLSSIPGLGRSPGEGTG